jgi:hypothetical protein
VDNSKNLLALTLCFSFIGSLVSADYIDCRRDDSSIAGGGAGAASGGSHSIVKSWMPEQIWVNEETGEFGTSKYPKDKISIRTSRSGYKIFARTNSRPLNVTYIVNLKRMEKSASVLMTASGFKNMGPLRYDCSFSSSTRSIPRNTSTNSLATYFKQMSQCDRKYVQQFLKGQGTYNGSIDGLWGNGTARGLSSVQKTGKLKGLSDLQVLKLLEKNPVCD